MNLAREYFELMRTVAARIAIPAVRSLYLPPVSASVDKHAEFGVLELADGSAGLVYLLLDDLRQRANAEIDCAALSGLAPLELVACLGEADPLPRALAMGAVNAISQHVFARAAFDFGTDTDILEQLRPGPGGRVGMVGYFPPLVARMREQGRALTVIELDPERVECDGDFEVTLDPARLADCSHVLCTATTLINNTLADVLAQARQAEVFALVGPTAGALPDPLFAAGVDIVAGSQVVDARALVARCRDEQQWGASVRKYSLSKDAYPGVAALLQRIGNRV